MSAISSAPSIADIFRENLDAYQKQYGPLRGESLRAAHAIVNCRTPLMGGRSYQCDNCGHELALHNSCRNRHCPQCQTIARLAWVSGRIEELLPVGYFHAVFTIPHELNDFALHNRASFYGLMLAAVKDTLLELSRDPKRLGASIGFVMVLHTWGQNLMDHPHIHCIVPGGGLVEKKGTWKPCVKSFLFPVPVLQKLFRGKLLDVFGQGVRSGAIKCGGALQKYQDPFEFKNLLDCLYAKSWVVYVKAPFASPQAVVKYLGRYTHRVAISNQRIISAENGMVSYSWQDYAHGGKRRIMTVYGVEFIRRFLLHILPRGFVRIRHCGILANRNRLTAYAKCRAIFNKKPLVAACKRAKRAWSEIIKELAGYDPTRCPECRAGTLVLLGPIPALSTHNSG